MSQIERIRSLMMITEQEQRPVTAPVNIDALITLILHVKDKSPEYFEDMIDYSDIDFTPRGYAGTTNKLGDLIEKNLRLFGLPKFDYIIEDFYGQFIWNNIELIRQGEKDKSKYIIPPLKKFLVTGEERYTVRKGDIYEHEIEAYSKEFIERLIESHEIMISDGRYIREEHGDSWDLEQEILEIEEIPGKADTPFGVNEQVNLDSYEAPFTSEDFVNYVNSEFDLDMLQIMRGVIDKRINELNTLLHMASRKEVKGFRK